jgi:hypothetical protein
MSKDIKYECKFVVYAPNHNGEDDIHIVKEVVHHPDGTKTPNLRFIKNFKRTFGVTVPGAQKNTVKKEAEDLKNLRLFQTTQSGMLRAVKAALQKPWSKERMRELQDSPYLYGTDISSTSLVKHAYMTKYDVVPTPYTVAVYDVETDVLHGTNDVIMSTLSFKHRVRTAIKASFMKGQADVINRLQALAEFYLGDILKARGITIEFTVEDSELDTCMKPIQKAHEWQPDFLTGWNLLFDIRALEKACEKASVDIRDYLNDPRIPKHYRCWDVKEGPAKRVTASGKVMTFGPAERFHVITNPASFYMTDAMGAYFQVRQGEQKKPSYSLDAILNEHLKRGKLKFEQANAYSKLAWHQFMQKNYPLEYVIYNIFDCIGVEMLDETTKDLAVSMPLYCETSDFGRFGSQPKRKVDALHYFYLEHGQMIGCTGSDMTEPGDGEVVDADGHVITLHAGRLVNNGLCCIAEDPNLRTNIRIGNSDDDVTGAYPSNQVVMNVSKATTVKEIIRIDGIDEEEKRIVGLNMAGGHTNAVEFCTRILDLPELETLRKAFVQELQRVN